MNKKGELRGLITLKDVEKHAQFPNAAKDSKGRLIVGAALGVTQNRMEHIEDLMRVGIDILVIDSAHGHSEKVLKTIREIKKTFPEIQIVGGNVATAEGTRDLIKAGADAVKVGVGPGSICTTRVVTGCRSSSNYRYCRMCKSGIQRKISPSFRTAVSNCLAISPKP